MSPRILTLVSLPLLLISVGVIGLYRVQPEAPLTTHLYHVLQLFVLEGDWVSELEHIPLEIQVLRFLAPLGMLASLLIAFVEAAWLQLRAVPARFYSGHLIVYGLSDESFQLAKSCISQGRQVLLCESDPGNRFIELCRDLGLIVYVDDPLRSRVLARMGLARAAGVVAMSGDDGYNVELTTRAGELLREHARKRDPMPMYVHLEDTGLGHSLERYPKFFAVQDVLEIRFFNAGELCARSLYRNYALERFADVAGQDRVHLVFVGFNSIAERVLLQTARVAHFATGRRTRVTLLVQEDAPDARRAMARNAQLAEVLDIRMLPQPDALELAGDIEGIAAATSYLVFQARDSHCVGTALELRRQILLGNLPNAPTFLHLRSSSGLAEIIESDRGPEIPDGLYPFGMLESVYDVGLIVNETADQIAKAIHSEYLDMVLASKQDLTNKPAAVPWERLPERLRRENRLEADHLSIKLRAAGRRLSAVGVSEFTTSEIEMLARMEKSRWLGNRYSFGWAPGEERNDLAMIHDQMKPWEALSEDDREYDRNSVAKLPSLLRRRVGLGLSPAIVIGVTGHRPNKLDVAKPGLIEACTTALADLRRRHPGASFEIMSQLAEGADRLVARLAMEQLEARLHVPLPLPYEVYLEDFGEAQKNALRSVDEFHTLMGSATEYYEMPLRYGSTTALVGHGGEAARAQQYALSGAYMVQRCHELIAIWDGNSGQAGGTSEVIRWWNEAVPDDYRYSDNFFPPVQRAKPYLILPSGDFHEASRKPER